MINLIRENECEKAVGIIQGKHDTVLKWIFYCPFRSSVSLLINPSKSLCE